MDQYSVYGADGLVDIAKSKEAYTAALISRNNLAPLEKTTTTQSDRLRDTIANNPIASRSSKEGESLVREASIKAVERLKTTYPQLKLTHRVQPNPYCRCGCNKVLVSRLKTAKYSDGHCQSGCGNLMSSDKFCSKECKARAEYLAPTDLSRLEINKKLAIDFNDSTLEMVRYGGGGISPDGGIVFLMLPKTKKLLIVGAVEHKYQGTNDKRAYEGLDKQSSGNAFERAYKNWHVIANYMRGEKITPYMVYVHGWDFEDPSSTIPDRATSMTNNNPFNIDLTENSVDVYGEIARRGSVFELWKLSDEQLTDTIYNMYDTSVKYYLSNYKGELDVI